MNSGNTQAAAYVSSDSSITGNLNYINDPKYISGNICPNPGHRLVQETPGSACFGGQGTCNFNCTNFSDALSCLATQPAPPSAAPTVSVAPSLAPSAKSSVSSTPTSVPSMVSVAPTGQTTQSFVPSQGVLNASSIPSNIGSVVPTRRASSSISPSLSVRPSGVSASASPTGSNRGSTSPENAQSGAPTHVGLSSTSPAISLVPSARSRAPNSISFAPSMSQLPSEVSVHPTGAPSVLGSHTSASPSGAKPSISPAASETPAGSRRPSVVPSRFVSRSPSAEPRKSLSLPPSVLPSKPQSTIAPLARSSVPTSGSQQPSSKPTSSNTPLNSQPTVSVAPTKKSASSFPSLPRSQVPTAKFMTLPPESGKPSIAQLTRLPSFRPSMTPTYQSSIPSMKPTTAETMHTRTPTQFRRIDTVIPSFMPAARQTFQPSPFHSTVTSQSPSSTPTLPPIHTSQTPTVSQKCDCTKYGNHNEYSFGGQHQAWIAKNSGHKWPKKGVPVKQSKISTKSKGIGARHRKLQSPGPEKGPPKAGIPKLPQLGPVKGVPPGNSPIISIPPKFISFSSGNQADPCIYYCQWATPRPPTAAPADCNKNTPSVKPRSVGFFG